MASSSSRPTEQTGTISPSNIQILALPDGRLKAGNDETGYVYYDVCMIKHSSLSPDTPTETHNLSQNHHAKAKIAQLFAEILKSHIIPTNNLLKTRFNVSYQKSIDNILMNKANLVINETYNKGWVPSNAEDVPLLRKTKELLEVIEFSKNIKTIITPQDISESTVDLEQNEELLSSSTEKIQEDKIVSDFLDKINPLSDIRTKEDLSSFIESTPDEKSKNYLYGVLGWNHLTSSQSSLNNTMCKMGNWMKSFDDPKFVAAGKEFVQNIPDNSPEAVSKTLSLITEKRFFDKLPLPQNEKDDLIFIENINKFIKKFGSSALTQIINFITNLNSINDTENMPYAIAHLFNLLPDSHKKQIIENIKNDNQFDSKRCLLEPKKTPTHQTLEEIYALKGIGVFWGFYHKDDIVSKILISATHSDDPRDKEKIQCGLKHIAKHLLTNELIIDLKDEYSRQTSIPFQSAPMPTPALSPTKNQKRVQFNLTPSIRTYSSNDPVAAPQPTTASQIPQPPLITATVELIEPSKRPENFDSFINMLLDIQKQHSPNISSQSPNISSQSVDIQIPFYKDVLQRNLDGKSEFKRMFNDLIIILNQQKNTKFTEQQLDKYKNKYKLGVNDSTSKTRCITWLELSLDILAKQYGNNKFIKNFENCKFNLCLIAAIFHLRTELPKKDNK